MKQPELGKKIAELRLSKGLTQGELAEKCNISLRTIQRIESAQVTPRSYTVKLIFSNLDVDFYNSVSDSSILSLFNLKSNTMKKVGLLSLILIVLILGISALTNVTNAQSAKKVKKVIEENNRNLMEWFNNQEVDKLVDLYRDDACLLNRGCGKSFIKTYYQMECRKTGRKWLIVNELAGTSY